MRYHATSKGNIPFSAEEEAEWDAQIFPQAKKEVLNSIKNQRTTTINASLNGFQVRDETDRANIEGAVEYYNLLTSEDTVPLTWTMEDDTEVVVTLADLQAIKQNYVIRKALAFVTYQQKKALIASATTVEELQTILEG